MFRAVNRSWVLLMAELPLLPTTPSDIEGLLYEIATMVVDKLGPKILKASLIAMSGAEQAGVVFEIDCALLGTEVSAALRAAGFDLGDGDGAHF
jgi:hypothetical protein